MKRSSAKSSRIGRVVNLSHPYDDMDQSNGGKRVYVGNLDWSVSWQDLKDHMRSAGKVLRANVLLESDGRSKGCGIVEFATVRDAQRAIDELNDSLLNDRRIFVREDREEEKKSYRVEPERKKREFRDSRVLKSPKDEQISRTLIVENLDDGYTWQELKDLLKTVGPVARADIRERENGSRIGIVEFKNQSDVMKAIRESSSLCSDDMVFRIMSKADTEDISTESGRSFRKLFVNSLSFHVSWQDLKDHFKTIGDVMRADVVMEDGDQHRSKGYGFVEYFDPEDAAEAVNQLNGSYLKGRQIFVREYREE